MSSNNIQKAKNSVSQTPNNVSNVSKKMRRPTKLQQAQMDYEKKTSYSFMGASDTRWGLGNTIGGR